MATCIWLAVINASMILRNNRETDGLAFLLHKTGRFVSPRDHVQMDMQMDVQHGKMTPTNPNTGEMEYTRFEDNFYASTFACTFGYMKALPDGQRRSRLARIDYTE